MGSREVLTTKGRPATATKGSVRIYYNGIETKTIEKPELISLDRQPALETNRQKSAQKVLTKSTAGSTSTSSNTSRSGQNSVPSGGGVAFTRSRSVCPTEQTTWTSVSNPKLETLFEQNQSGLKQNGKTLSDSNLCDPKKQINHYAVKKIAATGQFLSHEGTEMSFGGTNKRSVSNSELSKSGRNTRTKYTRNNSETRIKSSREVAPSSRRRSVSTSRVTDNTTAAVVGKPGSTVVGSVSKTGSVTRLGRQGTSVSVLRKKLSQSSIFSRQQSQKTNVTSQRSNDVRVQNGRHQQTTTANGKPERELNNNETTRIDKNKHDVGEEDEEETECDNEEEEYDDAYDSDDEREVRILQWLMGIEECGYDIVAPDILPEFEEPIPRQTDTAIHIVYDGD